MRGLLVDPLSNCQDKGTKDNKERNRQPYSLAEHDPSCVGTPEIEDLWSPMPFGLALIERYPGYLYSDFDCCLYSISVLNKRYYVIFTSVLFLSSTFKMPFCQPKYVAVWVITPQNRDPQTNNFFQFTWETNNFFSPCCKSNYFFPPVQETNYFFPK